MACVFSGGKSDEYLSDEYSAKLTLVNDMISFLHFGNKQRSYFYPRGPLSTF